MSSLNFLASLTEILSNLETLLKYPFWVKSWFCQQRHFLELLNYFARVLTKVFFIAHVICMYWHLENNGDNIFSLDFLLFKR